jgi:phospholipid transport system substrate-binding protein
MVRTVAALAFVLFACSRASADTWPTEALQQVFSRANEILTDPAFEDRPFERLLAVRKLVNDAFDFKGAAELASGDHWRARTAAEQEEFTWLFSDLLERAFVSRVASKASLTGGTRIRYLDEWIEGGTAVVQTTMARRNGGELLLDYHLIERDGAWKIRDVAIDGVSLMANYRAQLDRVLGNASFSELLSQMRAKVGVIDQPESPAPVATADLSDTPAASVAVTTAALSPPADMPATEEAPPQIHVASIADVPPPALEIRLATFEPVMAVPEAVEPPVIVASGPASRPPDEPMTPPATTTAAVVALAVATPPIAVTTPAVATSPAVVTPPAVKPPARAHTTRAYWLRMMTAGTAEEASRLVSRLRDGKFPIAVDRTNGRGKLMVSVRVGPFRDAEQAVLKLLDLQTKGHNPYLVAERD